MTRSKPTRSKSGPLQQGASPEHVQTSPTVIPSKASTTAPNTQQMAQPQRSVPLRTFPPVNAPPQLSTRQMQDLMRGNRNNRVSVSLENVPVCTVLRPVAKHFSRTWRRALANIHCKIVNITLPASAPSRSAPAAPSGNAPTLHSNTPVAIQEHPTPTPAETNAITFIVQWMERGGADPIGKEALLYPSGNVEELTKLRDLAKALEIDPLVVRTNRDLAVIRPKFCTLCHTPGHLRRTCVFCAYCKERTHMIGDCLKLRAKEERERQREERRARRIAERERREEADRAREEERDIREGRVAFNDEKTIRCWS